MFGYIRPVQGELKVKDLGKFKACYCGLCNALRRNYGVPARFILSYELVFLAMLLWDPDEPPQMKRGRCIASPLRKRCYCSGTNALDTCAGYSVILTYWKLRDSVTDEPFFRSIPYRLASLAIRGAYKKASEEFQEFDCKVSEKIKSLAEHELSDEQSLDRAADNFSQILTAAAPEQLPDTIRRPMLELLYHLGRWIYIIDAFDDIKDDSGAGRYNPVSARFKADGKKLRAENLVRLETTLAHSNNLLGSAFELLPENAWSEIVRNMIYLGMPHVCSCVLEGNWPPDRRAVIMTRNGTDL